MLDTARNAFKIPELKKRILFTLLMFLIFRLGTHIPVPGINPAVLGQLMGNNLFGFFDLISGGAFKNFTIFAMGITPYINSSIIMQLLTAVTPSLEQLKKEGEAGRRKISQYTRYGTLALALVQIGRAHV